MPYAYPYHIEFKAPGSTGSSFINTRQTTRAAAIKAFREVADEKTYTMLKVFIPTPDQIKAGISEGTIKQCTLENLPLDIKETMCRQAMEQARTLRARLDVKGTTIIKALLADTAKLSVYPLFEAMNLFNQGYGSYCRYKILEAEPFAQHITDFTPENFNPDLLGWEHYPIQCTAIEFFLFHYPEYRAEFLNFIAKETYSIRAEILLRFIAF